MLDAFDQLGSFYNAEKVQTQQRTSSSGIEAEYGSIKARLGIDSSDAQQLTHQLVLPPQLTPQTLARFLGEAKCCWVLEDFHKIEPIEKTKLAQVMKVFMDMADRYSELKIVAIGAVDTARQVIEYDVEMRNRVSEIYVPLMRDEEIKEISEKGEQLLNLRITEDVKVDLVKSSNGLASVCHQLCLNMCFAANVNVTLKKTGILNSSILKKAIEQYLGDASDTLKGAFDKAFKQERKTKFEDAKLIVEALLQVDQDGADRASILDKVNELSPQYPMPRLTSHLEKLQKNERGTILRYDPSSGRYSFKDPFYRAFALALAKKNQKSEEKQLDFITTDLEGIIVKLLKSHYTVNPPRQEHHKKPVPKMDWTNRVFSQRRNFKGRRR